MAKFVLTAQLELQAPKNASKVVNDIQRQLQGVTVPVDVKGFSEASKRVDQLTDSTKRAGSAAEAMGKSFGLAVKRFAAFTVASRAVSLFTNSLASAIDDAIAFQREVVRVSQVTGKSVKDLRGLTDTITRLSTTLGTSSKDLLSTATVLAQAGIEAGDLNVALDALAKTTLAPNFDSITETAEGAVAILAQFGKGVGALEQQLSSINAVAGAFAVESEDLIGAVRRFGGVFKASGGSLEELLAVFTSVRATTRESAESISTGLRTIFTRIQRPKTIEFLKQFGIELTTLDGKFVGPFEAAKRLSDVLGKLEQGDLTFIRVAEELGGFRQIGKVIPLLQQFSLAQEALNVAQSGSDSLAKDAATAQQALAVQIVKVKEEFLALVRSVADSSSFQIFARTSLEIASALIKVGDAIKPLIPLIGTLAAFKFAQGLGSFVSSAGAAVRGLGTMANTQKRSGGGKIHKFASGGVVPGTGNRDTVPAMLTPGEFVIRKSSVNKIGADTLAAMNENRYARGGMVVVQPKEPREYGAFILKGEETPIVKQGRKLSKPAADSIREPVKKLLAKTTEQDIRGAEVQESAYSQATLEKYFGKTSLASRSARGVAPKKGDFYNFLKTQARSLDRPDYFATTDKNNIRIDPNKLQAAVAAYTTNTSAASKENIQNRVKEAQDLANSDNFPIAMKGPFKVARIGGPNSDVKRKFSGLFQESATKALKFGVKSIAESDLVKSLNIPPITIDEQRLYRRTEFLQGARESVEGYLLEGVVGTLTNAKVGGGGTNFDFPSPFTQASKERLKSLFANDDDFINHLKAADAKRRPETAIKGDGALYNKVAKDIGERAAKGESPIKLAFAKGGLVQHLNKGGAVRNVGYIDGDVLGDPKNAAIVQEQIEKLGIKGGVAGYKQYLTELAVSSRKSNKVGKLTNILGMAGAGKSTLMLGNEKSDNATLRKTNRFPILTPEDISKASSIINVSASLNEEDIKNTINPADRTVVLSSSTKEEQNVLRGRRSKRDQQIKSGTSQTSFGRAVGTTRSAPTDSGYMEALLQANMSSDQKKKLATLGVTEKGFRRKKESELPEVREEKLNVLHGGLFPSTKGHFEAMQSGLQANPGAKGLVAVAPDIPVNPKDEHSYRSMIMSQKERAGMAKEVFANSYVSALPKSMGANLPSLFDVGVNEANRRVFVKPKAGSTISKGEKPTDKKAQEQTEARYGKSGLGVHWLEDRIGGISGTGVREAIQSSDIGGMKSGLTESGFAHIQGKMSAIQNRQKIAPEIVQRGASKADKKIAAIDAELAKYPARLSKTTPQDVRDKVEELRKQKEKIKSSAGSKPLRIMERLKKFNPEKYAFANGGPAPSDTVPAMLTPGEFVVNKQAAQSIGYNNLHRMNKHGVTGFAEGGTVGVQKFKGGGGVLGGGAGVDIIALSSAIGLAQSAISTFGDKSIKASETMATTTIALEKLVAAATQVVVTLVLASQARSKILAWAKATKEAADETKKSSTEQSDAVEVASNNIVQSTQKAVEATTATASTASADTAGASTQTKGFKEQKAAAQDKIDALDQQRQQLKTDFDERRKNRTNKVQELQASNETISNRLAAEETPEVVKKYLQEAIDKNSKAIQDIISEDKKDKESTQISADALKTQQDKIKEEFKPISNAEKARRDAESQAQEQAKTKAQRPEAIQGLITTDKKILQKKQELGKMGFSPDVSYEMFDTGKQKHEAELLERQKQLGTAKANLDGNQKDIVQRLQTGKGKKVSKEEFATLPEDVQKLIIRINNLGQAIKTAEKGKELTSNIAKLKREQESYSTTLKNTRGNVGPLGAAFDSVNIAMKRVAAVVKDSVSPYLSGAQTKMESLGAMFKNLPTSIGTSFSNANKAVRKHISDMATDLQEGFIGDVAKFTGKFIPQKVKDDFKIVSAKMSSFATGVVNVFRKDIPNSFIYAGKGVNFLVGKIKDLASNAYKGVKSSFAPGGTLRKGAGVIGAGASVAGGIVASLAAVGSQIASGFEDYFKRQEELLKSQDNLVGAVEAAGKGSLSESIGQVFTIPGYIEAASDPQKFVEKAVNRMETAQFETAKGFIPTRTQAALEKIKTGGTKEKPIDEGAVVRGSIEAFAKARSEAQDLKGPAREKAMAEINAESRKFISDLAESGMSLEGLKNTANSLSGGNEDLRKKLLDQVKTIEASRKAQEALNKANVDSLKITSAFGAAADASARLVAGLETGANSLAIYSDELESAAGRVGVDTTSVINNAEKELLSVAGTKGGGTLAASIRGQAATARSVSAFSVNAGAQLGNLKLSSDQSKARDELERAFTNAIPEDADPETKAKLEALIEKNISQIQGDVSQVDVSKLALDIQNDASELSKGFNQAVKLQSQHNATMTTLYQKREQLEQKAADAANQAIETQLEAAKIFTEFGGAELKPEQQLGARVSQFNNIGRLGGLNAQLTTGSAADIKNVAAEIGKTFADQTDQVIGNTLARGAGKQTTLGAFAGAAGVGADKRQEAEAANKALIQFTKQRVDLLKEELSIAQKKNAEEKNALEALMSGDLEGFLEKQASAGAGAALAAGSANLSGLFSTSALGAGFKTLEGQGLSDAQKRKAEDITLQRFGIQSTGVLSGTTTQEEALKSQGRELAGVLGELSQQEAAFAQAEFSVNNATITAAQLSFDRELTKVADANRGITENKAAPVQPAQGKYKGGLIYASRGMFVPRGTDTVPAMLTPGEFVVNRAAVQRGNNLQILTTMNNGGGASAPGAMSGGGQVKYYGLGGIVDGIVGAFSTALPQLTNVFTNFAATVDKLVGFKFHVALDPTTVNLNFNGASFLQTMKEDIKEELLKEIASQIPQHKMTQSGDLKKTNSVLGG